MEFITIFYGIGAIIALIGGLLFSSKDEEKFKLGKKLLIVAGVIGVIGIFI